MKKQNELTEVFSGSSVEAGMIKSLLENSGIKTFLENENMGSIAPWYITAGGKDAVKVIVLTSEYEKARSLIEEYNKNFVDGGNHYF